MGSRKLASDACFVLGYDRVAEANSVNSVFKKSIRHLGGLSCVSDKYRADSDTVITHDGKSSFFHSISKLAGVGAQLFDNLWRIVEHFKSFDRSSDRRRSDRV